MGKSSKKAAKAEKKAAQAAAPKTFKTAVIGYSPAFNMGLQHIKAIIANPGFEISAVCDLVEANRKKAVEDFPQIATYSDADKMLAEVKPNLVVIITPHNTHADLALKALKAGAHVVVEKPLAITTAEVKKMLAAAEKRGLMLSTFHNRRWDGDFVLLNRLVNEGLIGRVFRIEAGFYGFRKQGTWWRSNREISGGNIYDWGAHFTDWILTLANGPIDWVSGFQVKNPAWTDYTNEDHSEYTMQFGNGIVATLTISNISQIQRPKWVVRGDQGSITAGAEGFIVESFCEGRIWRTEVSYKTVESKWAAYYENVCKHLRDGEPLVITPESGARVIAVLDSANESARKGGVQLKPWLA